MEDEYTLCLIIDLINKKKETELHIDKSNVEILCKPKVNQNLWNLQGDDCSRNENKLKIWFYLPRVEWHNESHFTSKERMKIRNIKLGK